MNKKETMSLAIEEIYRMFSPYGATPGVGELKEILGWVYDQGRKK